VRTLSYDDASRIISCNTPYTFINFTYDLDDTLTSQEEWTSFFSDNTHRTITYTYDADGNRASAALPGTTTLGYTYTGRNQLKAVTAGIGGASFVDYIYDKNGNPTSRTPDNSTSSTFAYDAMNRVTSVTHNFVGNTRTLNYAYDSVGRRKYLQRVGDAVGDDGFGYDLNNQITSFIRNGVLSGGTVTGGTSTTFNFDASGNRTTVVSGGTTTSYTPNFLNQYTAITGAGNPTYDNNGNLISYSAWTYIYDSMNRLSSATNGTTTAQFFYDGLNRQIGRSATGSTNHMSVMDGWNTYAEFDPGSTTPSERLVYAGDDLVQSPLLDRYYYPDALGSTAYVAGVSGGLLEGYSYDLYGAPTFYDASGNPRSPNTSSYNITRLFTGQQWHAQIGLYNLRNRFLKPDIGRFLQPDPIGFAGDPANLYRYCGNNPANWSDPWGLDQKGRIPDDLSATIGGQPYPGDPGAMPAPTVPSGGGYPEMPPININYGHRSFTPGADYPSAPLAGVPLTGGGGPRGGAGRRQGGFYAPRNYNRFNRALAHVVGPTALLLPAQSLRNAPVLINIFSSNQLGLLNHYVNGYPIQPTDGMHSYYPAPSGTIYVARDVTSVDGFNGTYAHELADMLIGNLTHGNELMFGDPLDPEDPDVGHQVELSMFNGHIPPDE
jgi:RHS repeat-associated protein